MCPILNMKYLPDSQGVMTSSFEAHLHSQCCAIDREIQQGPIYTIQISGTP